MKPLPASIFGQPSASSSRRSTMFWSGPWRSISVALRYCPRRSHLVQASRIMSDGARDSNCVKHLDDDQYRSACATYAANLAVERAVLFRRFGLLADRLL
jgi:hypothetical protein